MMQVTSGEAIKQNNKDKPQATVTTSDSEEQTLTSVLTNCSKASHGVISRLKKISVYDIDAPDRTRAFLRELIPERILALMPEKKRSTATDGVISSLTKTPAYDIDTSDALNELAVVEYVEDIYGFYKESACLPQNYMSSHVEINERMRATLIDWIIQVHHRLMLRPESLYLTVYMIDQYLSTESVPGTELKLIGVSAMLIACKHEELWECVEVLLRESGNAFSKEQVLSTEKSILSKLQWNLTVPTVYMFVARYLKDAMGDKKLENITFFYAGLALVEYSSTRCSLTLHQ
ncbi:hypothetical protein ACP70R_046097 [Stipagrostis hirtigluma subsp. patula]